MSKDYIELLRQSYKKLKSSIYFDKTQLILRDKIVRWESDGDPDKKIEALAKQIQEDSIEELFEKICSGISYSAFPKSLEKESSNNNESESSDSAIFITNWLTEKVKVKDAQYFIDMSVEGYILGVAWVLCVGYLLDERVYEHSYGNRLRKNLLDDHTQKPTYSPYLFEPYFQQYESWRDTALEYAKKTLDKDQDVVLLTLDFRRFFYQVNVESSALMELIRQTIKDKELAYCELAEPLTWFVSRVIEDYSNALRKACYGDVGERMVLPIGFHPSYILANYCLKKFDETLVDGWNPLYYGRYVDDIIIVDKVEKSSWIYKSAEAGSLTAQNMLDYYLLSDDAWRRSTTIGDPKERGLLFEDVTRRKKDQKTFVVNSDFVQFEGSDIIVQNSKVKIFYFNAKQSDALLDCFQNKLNQNRSEFRFLPEDESVFQDDDYSEIYALVEKDGPNKLRGVEDVTIDKFNLSKFLGKFMRISGLIIDPKEKRFEKDIDKIFNHRAIIDNYTAWEKVLSILANNSHYDAIERFVAKAVNAIDALEFDGKTLENIKYSLRSVLIAAINRSLAVVWGEEVQTLIRKIVSLFEQSDPFTEAGSIDSMRRKYCSTRMCDKYSLVITIDGFITKKGKCSLNDDQDINLTKFSDFVENIDLFDFSKLRLQGYVYHPYLITMNDLTVYFALKAMRENNHVGISNVKTIDDIKKFYVKVNYLTDARPGNVDIPIDACDFDHKGNVCIKVGDSKKTKLKVAVANSILYDEDFEKVLKGDPNRNYARYESIMKVVNEAIRNNVDMLVMPECFVPYEWIPILSRTCAKNEIAIVTGVEHLRVKAKNLGDEKSVFNLTAVILPFVEENYKFSYVHFHSKTHFSPDEKDSINSFRCVPREGSTYELFCWNDFWFPVYCCYELASIRERSLFHTYADAIVAVEWNKDTKYYSNIVESLSRDLHCFCVQVNTAKYGDSRITQPSKSEEKDIINVKGGLNPTILLDYLDIQGLRSFQIQGNILQAKSKLSRVYKPTPPDFNYDILQRKIDGTLWDDLKHGRIK